MDSPDSAKNVEAEWEPRRGVRFELPLGWSFVDGLPEGEEASHLDGVTYFWYGSGFPGGERDGWWIVTTPNSTWIPQPYFFYRDVRLRQDGFLGHEDPVLWPQLYNEAMPHLACVSFNCPEGSDARFFRQKVEVTFVDPPTTFPRKCELSANGKLRCREIWDRVKHKFTTLVRKTGQDRHRRLNVITSQLELGFGTVIRFRGMYLELSFRFAILCRLYLEFEAYTHHHELSEAHEFSMNTHPVNGSLVGAITFSETVCHRFHRMGVPVWLVRRLGPNSGAPCRLIEEKYPLNLSSGKTPPGGVKFALACVPNVRPVFEGAYDDPAYLTHIVDWIRDCFRTDLGPNHPLHTFFASYQRKPRTSVAPEVVAQKKRKAENPNDGRTPKTSKVGRSQMKDEQQKKPDKQQEDLRLLLDHAKPKPSAAWDMIDQELEQESKPSLRLAPALDVFTGVENVLQLKRFVYVWLKVKHKWLLRVSEELQPPTFANRRAWRTFMRGSFDPTPIKPDSEAGRSRLRFTDYLGLPEPPTFDITNTKLGSNPPRHLERTVDRSVIKNALYEINDLNFLHDVYEVELRRTWDLPSTIVNGLRYVAGDNPNFFVSPSVIPRASITDRLRWITALRDVVKEWPTTLPKPQNFELEPRTTSRGPNVEDVFALELAVARFYCHVAGEILGRKATIPLYR